MVIWQRIKAAWAALWNDADTIEQRVIKQLSAFDLKVDKGGSSVIGDIDSIIARIKADANLTWKELHMALADIITSAATAIQANTQAISTASAAAVTAATTPLNEQITSLTSQLTAAQTEITDATNAASNLTQAVSEQTTAINPPAA